MTRDLPLDFSEPLLADFAHRRPFSRGRLIGVQGQPCDGVYIITEGRVLLCREDHEGSDYALYLLGPGDLFGEGVLHPDSCWLVSARGATDGCAYLLPAGTLPRLFEYCPALGAHLLQLLSLRLERAYRRLDVHRAAGARERLFRLLTVLSDYHGEVRDEEVWMPLPMTQAELGEMVGLARETVARAMTELEQEGIIRREGRKSLWLRTGTGD
jgi:CRP/FNR family transcriptional regulator